MPIASGLRRERVVGAELWLLLVVSLRAAAAEVPVTVARVVAAEDDGLGHEFT